MNLHVNFIKKTSIAAVLALSFLSTSSIGSQISLSPPSPALHIEEEFSVDLYVSGMEDTDLSAFSLNVNYDKSILEFISYSLTDNLGANGIDALDLSLHANDGCANIAQTSILSGDDFGFQADKFSLGTLFFRGIGYGTSLLIISDALFVDGPGDSFISMDIGCGTASVPEPATAVLIACGALAFFLFYRRFNFSI